jgi:hypothetical protein
MSFLSRSRYGLFITAGVGVALVVFALADTTASRLVLVCRRWGSDRGGPSQGHRSADGRSPGPARAPLTSERGCRRNPTKRAEVSVAVDAVGFEAAHSHPVGRSTREQSRVVGKNVRAGAEAGLDTHQGCLLGRLKLRPSIRSSWCLRDGGRSALTRAFTSPPRIAPILTASE